MNSKKPSHNNRILYKARAEWQKAQVFLRKIKIRALQDFRQNKEFWYYTICGVLIVVSFAYIVFPEGYGKKFFRKPIPHKPSIFDLQDRTGIKNPECPGIWEMFEDYRCPFGVRSAQDFEKCFTMPEAKGGGSKPYLIRKYMAGNTGKPQVRYIMPDTEGTYINISPEHPVKVFVLHSANGSIAADDEGLVYVQRDPCTLL